MSGPIGSDLTARNIQRAPSAAAMDDMTLSETFVLEGVIDGDLPPEAAETFALDDIIDGCVDCDLL